MRSTTKANGSSSVRRAGGRLSSQARRAQRTGTAAADSADFVRLAKQWVPRAIRGEKDFAACVARVESLVTQRRPSAGHKLYVDTLLQLIESFERERTPISDVSGSQVLAELISQHAVTSKQLAEILGVSPAAVGRILKDERSLSVAQVRRLADYFSVSSQVFLG